MTLYIHFYNGFARHVVLTLLITLHVMLWASSLKADTISEPLHPLPDVKLNPSKVELGKRLFHDQRLSGDNSISCASCHSLKTGGVDRLRVSKGVRGAEGGINAPTVLNSGFNFSQFWDGRATNLEDQIDGPVHATLEMDSNWPDIIAKLKQDPSYQSTFKKLYPEGIQSHTIKDAIATFERSLVTPSRFDQYLQGNQRAISEEEKKGYEHFKSYGCVACHQGVNIGGNMYQYFGVMGNYFEDRGQITAADYGRYNVTGKERDRFKFKVPSLRNVALTPPYFHDGSAKTLDDAVKVMAKYQLGRNMPEQDRKLIVQFLQSLTGLSVGADQETVAKN
ncbi:MAG: cytochrome B6 [Candidatus Entotheonella gemina]|uniref:Cytochrome B6 n=1 Tax=Candidatus Entotheonella gemina TaxID=1429439 RepID=W4MH56_9BACT|nr:MAG: cytochrome B6 [Candidatus Entotheonella gemina]